MKKFYYFHKISSKNINLIYTSVFPNAPTCFVFLTSFTDVITMCRVKSHIIPPFFF